GHIAKVFIDGRAGKMIEHKAFCAKGSTFDHLAGMTEDEVKGSLIARVWRQRCPGIKALRRGWVKRFLSAVDEKGGDQRVAICQCRRSSSGIANRHRNYLEPARGERDGCLRATVGPAAAQSHAYAQAQLVRFLVGKTYIAQKFRRQVRKIDNSFYL